MHFHPFSLALLTSILLFVPSCLTSPNDVLYIQKLTADYSINFDTKNFKDLDVEFTANATLDAGNGVFSKGLPAIKARLAGIVGTNVTQSSITTSSITLLPPFDSALGGASRASAIQYVIGVFIGQAPADAGKTFTVFGVFKDQFVKTELIGDYGGWRFSERVLQILVSFPLSLSPSLSFGSRKKESKEVKKKGRATAKHIPRVHIGLNNLSSIVNVSYHDRAPVETSVWHRLY